MQQTDTPALYLETLTEAGVVDHVLEMELGTSSAEISLLESIQGIAAGPVFRVAKGHYAFSLPEDQVGPLTDALSGSEGVLRAVQPEGKASPHLDDTGVALLSAVRDAAENAPGPALAQAIVSASFAVETARMAAEGIDGQQKESVDLSPLEAKLEEIQQAIANTPKSDGEKKNPDGWLFDLMTQREADWAGVLQQGIASPSDLKAIEGRIEDLAGEIKASSPAAEKVYALLRQRLEKLQIDLDQTLSHLGGGVQRKSDAEEKELRANLRGHLDTLRARITKQKSEGEADASSLLKELDAAFGIISEWSARGARLGGLSGGVPLRDMIKEELTSIRKELETLSTDAQSGRSLPTQLESQTAKLDRALEILVAADAKEQPGKADLEALVLSIERMGQKLAADGQALKTGVAAAIGEAHARAATGMDELQARMDMRLQTLISQDSGFSTQLTTHGEQLERILGEVAKDKSDELEAVFSALADLSEQLAGAQEGLGTIAGQIVAGAEPGFDRLEGALLSSETRLSEAVGDVSKGFGELEGRLSRIETFDSKLTEGLDRQSDAQRQSAETVQNELSALGQTLGEGMAQLGQIVGTSGEVIDATLPDIAAQISGLNGQVSGLEEKLEAMTGSRDLAILAASVEQISTRTSAQNQLFNEETERRAEAQATRLAGLEDAFTQGLAETKSNIAALNDRVARVAELPEMMERRLGQIESVLDTLGRKVAGDIRDGSAVATALSEILRRLDGKGIEAGPPAAPEELSDTSHLSSRLAQLDTAPIAEERQAERPEPEKSDVSRSELQQDLRMMLAEYLSDARKEKDGPRAAAG